MICSITFFISIVFFCAMLLTNIMACSTGLIKNYMDKLPPDLKQKYEEIRDERLKINFAGYGAGFLVSLIIIFYNYKIKQDKMSAESVVLIVISTCFIVQYLFYILYPKSQWMLEYLTTQEQKIEWLKVYRNMQLYWHGGLLLGLIAVGFLAFAFKC